MVVQMLANSEPSLATVQLEVKALLKDLLDYAVE